MTRQASLGGSRVIRSDLGFPASPGGNTRQPREQKERSTGSSCGAEHHKDSEKLRGREIREQEDTEPTADHEQRRSDRPPQMRARFGPWFPGAEIRIFPLGEHGQIDHGVHPHAEVKVGGRRGDKVERHTKVGDISTHYDGMINKVAEELQPSPRSDGAG